jgi:hypothetical protein
MLLIQDKLSKVLITGDENMIYAMKKSHQRIKGMV